MPESPPFSTGEHTLTYQHLEQVGNGDLLLFDRLYGSFKLMHTLLDKEIHFCIRMKDNWFYEVEKFHSEPGKDKITTFYYEGKSFKVRLLKIDLLDNKTEILCSSLVDPVYDLEDFKEVYHSRWG